MTGPRIVGLEGPVGFILASLGYAVAVTMARTFVALEAHCVQACPIVKVEGFQFHHLYYGLIISAVSLGVLVLGRQRRVRWDASLLLGIGIGLTADETGFLFLNTSYGSLLSLSIAGVVVLVLVLATSLTAATSGLLEFRSLGRADVLTFVAILLVPVGMVIFDRPFQILYGLTGGVAWTVALVLFGLYGRTHIRKVLLASGPTSPV